jgi:ubiquinone/menaquinone biosynthesis C-methylase UbiE
MKSELEIGSYRFVDRTSDPHSYIATMDMMDQHPLVREAREIMRSALHASPGDVILDLGCGTGTEARELAERVGTEGRVIGVDGSEAMVNEARRRAQHRNLSLDFQPGDASALPFDDDTFSGCRAERLFQHLSDPRRVIAELVRVSRSRAGIAVSDADWGSATLDAPNKSVTRRILNCFCDSVSNGWMGRQHLALFKSAGLTTSRFIRRSGSIGSTRNSIGGASAERSKTPSQ